MKEITKNEKSAIRKSATWKECNMKRVQHEKNARREKCTLETVKHEKSASLKNCNRKKINMKKMQHEKIIPWK